MGVKNGKINRPEAESIARQITNKTQEESWFGYEAGDDYGQGTPMP